MQELMNRLLWMSVVGGIVILAVLVLRLFLRRAPKLFSYLLWFVVWFRLLCPAAWESGVSFIELGQRFASRLPDYVVTETASEQENGKILAGNDALAVIGRFVSDGAKAGGPESGEGFSNIPEREKGTADAQWTERRKTGIPEEAAPFLMVIWLLGIGVLSGYTAVREYKLRCFLRGARREEKNIFVKSGLSTSFVTGLFRPRIYLPEGLGDRERQYVLLHERTHIKRGDVFFCRLFYLALILHWFNPLVWAAYFLCIRDMEMACDETVVRRLGEQIKKEYSRSLLAMAAGGHAASPAPLAFGGGDTKRRIRNVLNCKKIRPGIAAVCAFVLIAAALVLATNPRLIQGNVSDTQIPEAGSTALSGSQTPEADAPSGNLVSEGAGSSGSTQAVEEKLTEEPLEAVVSVKSIARSARAIDSAKLLDGEGPLDAMVQDGMAFAADCRFYINYNVETYRPQEVDFDGFAAQIEKDEAHIGQPCRIVFSDGLVREITLLGTHSIYGLNYVPFSPYWTSAEGLDELAGLAGEGALERYYTLVSTTELDVADGEEAETIEVYTGDCGYGEDGFLLVHDAAGAVRYSAYASNPRAGWKHIYAGRLDGNGQGFLMTLYLEDREIFGYYEYQVFRLKADGAGVEQIAGSSFEWGNGYPYDADEFLIWCHNLGHYLEDSRLLLSMYWGELRTEQVCDSDRYCYRTLAPARYEDPYEGRDVR